MRAPGAAVAIPLLVVGGLGLGWIPYQQMQTARTRVAHGLACVNNGKQLALGMMMYVQDYDEKFPPPNSWSDGLLPYVKTVIGCPDVPRPLFVPDPSIGRFGPPVGQGYAANAYVEGKYQSAIEAPAEVPMLFESTLNAPGSADLGASFTRRHPGQKPGWGVQLTDPTGTIAFADGHAKPVLAFPTPDEMKAVPAPQPETFVPGIGSKPKRSELPLSTGRVAPGR